MRSLFESVQLGSLVLANRVFMAPLTRNRANADGVQGELAATYYAQRASAGLIITEATQISPMGKGYINTPGIHSPQQVRAWRRIVDAVHKKGGRIFLQLWHVGRISHSSLLPNNSLPVAPSAIRANSHTFIASGPAQVSEPVALTLSGIRETLADYRAAAANAKEAGFDGVEIHAANGYLIDQFLRSGSNQRSDLYGGSASNRVRFLTEVAEKVLEVWDKDRIGVRISPTGAFNDMEDSNPTETFGVAVDRLNSYRIGYLHVVESAQDGRQNNVFDRVLLKRLRGLWKGFYVVNGGYDGRRGKEAVQKQHADAVAYGRAFLANPDLPRRLKLGAPLNEPDQQTFYGGDRRGYTDYPSLSGDVTASS
ncbi:MAG TPA: alkene reductase [Pyrinomonadaceae bacterium]|nr:alkene reductase [Pyrinomonadaceae bacterium]